MRRGLLEVGQLGRQQGVADPHRARPVAELLGELVVDPLAVLDEVGVTVLVAGAQDRGHLPPCERLRPVEGAGDVRDAVGIDDVVARVAADAEDDRVLEVRRGSDEVVGRHDRREVGRERTVRAEVPAQERDVVPAAQQLGLEGGGGPAGGRRIAVRVDQRAPIEAGSRVKVRLDRPGGVLDEVVAGHERGAGADHGLVEVGLGHTRNLARGLHEPPDREVRDREVDGPEGDGDGRAIGVLAEHVVAAEAGFGGGGRLDRREVVDLRADRGGVRVAEERHDVVAAGEDDVLDAARGIALAVGVDDILGRLGDQVLGVDAARVGIRLDLEVADPTGAGEVNDDAIRGAGQLAELGDHRRRIGRPEARRVREDDGVRWCWRSGPGFAPLVFDGRTQVSVDRHLERERAVQAGHAVLAVDADVEVAGAGPRVGRGKLVGEAEVVGPGDEAVELGRGEAVGREAGAAEPGTARTRSRRSRNR